MGACLADALRAPLLSRRAPRVPLLLLVGRLRAAPTRGYSLHPLARNLNAVAPRLPLTPTSTLTLSSISHPHPHSLWLSASLACAKPKEIRSLTRYHAQALRSHTCTHSVFQLHSLARNRNRVPPRLPLTLTPTLFALKLTLTLYFTVLACAKPKEIRAQTRYHAQALRSYTHTHSVFHRARLRETERDSLSNSISRSSSTLSLSHSLCIS